MKKIFTLICLALSTLSAMGTDYTGKLTVTVNDSPSEQQTTISITQDENGKYTFSLINFCLEEKNDDGSINRMGVGNIVLADREGTTVDGITTITYNDGINIEAGDDPTVDFWMGPMLAEMGPVPLEMVARFNDEKLDCEIHINLKTLNQIIDVTFSGDTSEKLDFSQLEGMQILNSDFEDWSGSEFDYVPVGWHSFESASGSYAGTVKNNKHTSKNTDDLHDGTTGKASLKLVPVSMFGIMANGTISTGRMNAGAMFATNKKNHAQMDISVTETSNGTPFYAKLNQRPTALSVWVKFSQGTAQSDHPNATVSAAITNGKYYQEPTADEDSSMVIGYAINNKIAAREEWQHLYVPFSYNSKNFNTTDEPQAIMVTLSTNADPGQGSKGDVLLVDDMELIYTQKLTIPECGYAMMTNVAMTNHKVTIPEGLTAYTVELNGTGEPVVTGTYEAGTVLNYETALLLSGKPGEYEFATTLYPTTKAISTEGSAFVKASELNTPNDEYVYYRLTEQNGELGFYKAAYGLKIQESEALLRVKADQAAEKYQHIFVKPEKNGDLNNDGYVNVADVMLLVNHMLGNYEKGKFFISYGDMNNDNKTTVADVMAIVNISLNGSKSIEN